MIVLDREMIFFVLILFFSLDSVFTEVFLDGQIIEKLGEFSNEVL